MAKAKILLQLDPDAAASSFDAVVAVDAGVEHLLQYGGMTPEKVRGLVHGAIFTRGMEDLASTAIFVGGSDVAAGEALLAAVRDSFFGPMRVSVMLDANGANTTAAAAVLAAARHVPLAGATALVLAATGPVGSRAARLLAGEGAIVRCASRSLARSEAVCERVRATVNSTVNSTVSGAEITAWQTANDAEVARAIDGASIVIAAGAAGVTLLSSAVRTTAKSLRVAIDLNAVPPLGVEGVKANDRATERDGVICYGALGVGGTKMKIHKEAIRRLFTRNDLLLDAVEVMGIAKEIG